MYILLIDKNKNIQQLGNSINIQKKLHLQAIGKIKNPGIKFIKAVSSLMMPTTVLLTTSSTTLCETLPVSTTTLANAPVTPVPVVNCGPINNQVLPVQIFNC